MKMEKEFDCVRMKDEIQAKLLEEYKGLSDEEIEERRRMRIASHPVLGPLLKEREKRLSPSTP
jgi:hypothetical protein